MLYGSGLITIINIPIPIIHRRSVLLKIVQSVIIPYDNLYVFHWYIQGVMGLFDKYSNFVMANSPVTPYILYSR